MAQMDGSMIHQNQQPNMAHEKFYTYILNSRVGRGGFSRFCFIRVKMGNLLEKTGENL